MLFIPWIGLAFGALQGPHAGWALLGPLLLSAGPIALYLALEQFRSRRGEAER